MAIDPSIIGNVMVPAAPQLPDVNAMMQTRTAGMENIYKIERQRQADAAAAQEKATADQEAATIKALLPAYTYGIQTGDMAGALNLVPPEMQDGLRPYVDALAGKSPDEVKAALIGSLSSSAMGQEALAAIQRAGTLSVQQGQLTLAQQNAAREAEAAARGEQMTPYQQAQIELEKQKIEAGKAKETADETKKRLADEKREKDLALVVSELETILTPGGLIDQSTNSYLGAALDTAAATIGWGTDSAAATARIAPIADLVLKMVPRFEGPQSNYDVQSYKDAAGNLADPTVPNSIKRAAAEEIKRLFKKYQGQFEYAPDGGGGGGVPQQISSDEEYDALPSGTEFIDPDGVRRRKP